MRRLEALPSWLLAGVLAVIVALCVGAGGYAMLQGAERESLPVLSEATQGGAEAVGRAVTSQIEKALGYGIPLDRLNGVTEYLKHVSDGAPQVEGLAIVDAAGKILFSTGGDIEGLNFPLQVAAQPAGSLILQVASPLVAGAVSRLEAAVAVAALLCGVLAGLGSYLFLVYHLRTAERQLAHTLALARDGHFKTAPPPIGRGIVVAALRGLDRCIEPVREAQRRLEDAAATVQAIDFDGSLKERLDPLLAEVNEQTAAGAGPSSFVARAKIAAWPASIVVGCYMAAAPFIANYAIDREWSAVSAAWWPGVVLMAEIAAVSIAALGASRLPGHVRHACGWAGLVLAGIATAFVAWSHSYLLFVLLRACAGAGLGLFLAAALNSASLSKPIVRLTVFAALCAGPLLGGLVGEAVGRRMGFLAIGCGLVLSAALMPLLRNRPGVDAPHPHGAELSGWLAAASLGAIGGAVILVWIPSGPGYDDYLTGGLATALTGLVCLAAIFGGRTERGVAFGGLPAGMIAGIVVLGLSGGYTVNDLIAPVAVGLVLAMASHFTSRARPAAGAD
ncbi:hypothetical protein FHS85_000523 [Rhodoligotrophos appendicifer]|uniref:MFS transporter n=1 Tax=Rhodoligotrophos appendicifer TaxID=987056 RepID=UPI00117E179E|nr:MFS transporter [Rhodoligotrophos appendicifer]